MTTFSNPKLSDRIRPDIDAATWVVEGIENLEQKLAAAQADAKTAWEKAGEACTAHAASIEQVKFLLDAIYEAKRWIVGNKAHNILDKALSATEPKP